jgi:hypothetical protein
VQTRCRDVVAGSVEKQATSTGLPLSGDMIRPFAEPDSLSGSTFDGTEAGVGVQMSLKDRGIWLYYYLEWDQEKGAADHTLGIDIVLYFGKADEAQRVWKAVKPHCSDSWGLDAGRSIYLYRGIPVTEILGFEIVMKQAINEWNTVWRMVGGLPPLLSTKKLKSRD